MGDQEHSKADGQQCADGNQPNGTIAAGRGQLNTLTVVDNGMGDLIVLFGKITGCGLDIVNLAVLISKHGKQFCILLVQDKGNCGRECIIAIGSLGFQNIIGSLCKTQNHNLTVFRSDHQVVLLAGGCVIVAQVSGKIFLVDITGGIHFGTGENFLAQAIHNVNTFNVGGDNVHRVLAFCIAINTEFCICQVATVSPLRIISS